MNLHEPKPTVLGELEKLIKSFESTQADEQRRAEVLALQALLEGVPATADTHRAESLKHHARSLIFGKVAKSVRALYDKINCGDILDLA